VRGSDDGNWIRAGKKMDRVTVFIPTYNRAKYLRQCLAALTVEDVDREHLDVVISDNASTDDTVSVIESFRDRLAVRYYRNKENIGIIRNYNRVVDLEPAAMVVLVADDVLLAPGFIRRAAQVLGSDEGTPLFATTMLQVVRDVPVPHYPQWLSAADLWPTTPRLLTSREWAASCLFRCPVYTGACAFRRSFLDRTMPWRVELLDNADRVMYFAAWRLGVAIWFEPWVGATTVYDGHNEGWNIKNDDEEYRMITAEFIEECARGGFDVLGFWRDRLRSTTLSHRELVLQSAFKALGPDRFERAFGEFIPLRRKVLDRLGGSGRLIRRIAGGLRRNARKVAGTGRLDRA